MPMPTSWSSGETGTGKEVTARALHDLGRRRGGRFVAVNCGAIPDTMIESELFGHEPGAFTGARERRIGKIEHASGGHALPRRDRVDAPGSAGAAPAGAARARHRTARLEREIKVDLRVVAATKAELPTLVAKGSFREDLVYRLNVVTVRLPPCASAGGHPDPVPPFPRSRGRTARPVAPAVDPGFLAASCSKTGPAMSGSCATRPSVYLLGLDDDEAVDEVPPGRARPRAAARPRRAARDR
jgi:two-component system C4-dicarboxylate transport response regulator DctD